MSRPHMYFDRQDDQMVTINLNVTAEQANKLAQIINLGIIGLGSAPPPFPPDLYVAESIVNAVIHDDIQVLRVAFGPYDPSVSPSKLAKAIRTLKENRLHDDFKADKPGSTTHIIKGRRATDTQYPTNNPHDPTNTPVGEPRRDIPK